MASLGFFSDPHVQYLSQVLEEILAGNLQIPRFQRPYLWDWDRRLDLFRSVRVGIPMGAVMVWRTSGEHLKTYSQFGNIKFRDPLPTGPRQYLLDGVQRLSTLLSAVVDPFSDKVPESENNLFETQDIDRHACFDLVEDDFVALSTAKIDSTRHMPLHLLMDSVGLFRFQRALIGPKVEDWIKVSDSLARAFREYKIPVIPIVSDDLGLASQTFQRINSSGLQMGEKDMLHALTYSTNFDFAEKLDELKESLVPIGWDKLDDDLLLKLVKATLGLDIYRDDVNVVSIKINNSPDVLDVLKTGLYKAAAFFRDTCNMPTPDFIPYGLHIVAVTEAFRESESSPDIDISALNEWVWETTYLEYFTGLSGDRANAQIEIVRNLARQKLPGLIPSESISFQSKSRFDMRTARSKAFVVALARMQNKVHPHSGLSLLEKYGRSCVVSGIPREFFLDPASYSSPGNRFLVAPSELRLFRENLLEPFVWPQEFAVRNCLHDSAEQEITKRDFDTFVRYRNSYVSVSEGRYLSQIRGEYSADNF